MSHHTMNNRFGGGASDSGVFDPLNESDPRSGSGFALPSAGEAELRRLMHSRLNAYFDAEGQRDRVAARESLHDLAGIPGGGDELAAMRRVLSGFDTRPEHPDLTRLVLAKVAKRGTFLSKPARRRISAARVLIAASLLVVVSAFVYIERTSRAPVDGPAGALSAVVEAQRSDAAESVRNLARAVDTLSSDLIEPVGALIGPESSHRVSSRVPRQSLSLGDTSDYEESASSRGSAMATAMPLTRLMPIVRTELDEPNRPALAFAPAPEQPRVAMALASAKDAWSVAPSPSILLSDLGASPPQVRVADGHASEPLRLDLNDFVAARSIDGALERGGLLTSAELTTGSAPEVRLRPDGSRTVLWWVFPNAAVEPKD